MKYLSCPDFHFSMAHLETSLHNADAIAQAAYQHKVDFIALPGDLFATPIYASDAGGINELRAIVRSWLLICDVLAVGGTPSHDAPGCYGPLEDVGLTLLRPGQDSLAGDGIVFGIPELRKDTIQAALGLPAEQANAEAVRLFRQYLQEYVAPTREQYADLPAIGILHGVVTDYHRDDVTDPKIKTSDIIIRTEDLALAGLDYWSLGHIHTPWASSVIPASYAGSWGTNWGETGFVPCFEYVTVERHSDPVEGDGVACMVERIPYGTPKREKIRRPEDANDPSVAYWLESDDPDAKLPDGVHPWSRVTLKEHRAETRRITAEQAEAATTLVDLFRLADPEFDEALVPKVEATEQTTGSAEHQPIDVRVLSVEIQGCTFFNGETRSLDIAALPDGLTAIIGENGSGKSALLAFCTPYPVVVGKDTQSGRPSAIKDFFSGRDSLIRKRLTVNGVPHEHLITIKGAHTQSPKVECYLTIDGVPQLETGTWDTMMAACEELYGSYSDYSITTFYEQPQQASSNQSGLMSARMVDCRDLVQNIAGIDRSRERQHALDEVKRCEREIATLSAKIEALSAGTDTTELEESLEWTRAGLKQAESALSDLVDQGQQQQALVETLTTRKQEAEAALERRGSLDTQQGETEQSITALIDRVADLRKAVESLEVNREQARLYDERAERITGYERQKAAVATHNAEAQRVYAEAVQARGLVQEQRNTMEREIESLGGEIDRFEEKARSEQQEHENRIESEIGMLGAAITLNEEKIKGLEKKCPQCGYVDPEAVQSIEAIRKEIEEMDDKRSEFRVNIERADIIDLPTKLRIDTIESDRGGLIVKRRDVESQLKAVILPDAPISPELLGCDVAPLLELSTQNDAIAIDLLRQYIETGIKAEAEIATTETQITTEETRLATIVADLAAIVIDSTVAERHAEAVRGLEALRTDYTAKAQEITRLETTIERDEAEIQRRRDQAAEVEAMRELATDHNRNLEHWTYIARMLGPDKIPALELEIMLDTIDADATRNIAPYLEGRFSIRTETQGTGKKGQVDRFDILVHDNETGAERSFLRHSPGQKAFFNDAYVKALVRQRNARGDRSYSPIISDEADGPISPDLVPAFYEMQTQYYNGIETRVLIVSHAPGAHQFVESHVEVGV